MGKIEKALGKISDGAKEAVGKTIKDSVLGIYSVPSRISGGVEAAQEGVRLIDKAIDRVGANKGKQKAKRLYAKEQTYMDRKQSHTHLIIQVPEQDHILIFDREETLRYTANGNLEGKKKSGKVLLFNMDKSRAGAIRRETSTNSRVFHVEKDIEFIITLEGKDVATVISSIENEFRPCMVEPFGWSIAKNRGKWDYSICTEKEEVAHICKRNGYDKTTYILDYPNKQQELISITIALILIYTDKNDI